MRLEIPKIDTLNTSISFYQTEKKDNFFEPLLEFNKQTGVDQNPKKQDCKNNIDQALKNGSLIYHPGQKNCFLFKDRKAEYEYHANGRETIGMIKEKFGLKDGAIRKCNPNIKDDDWMPPKGQKIFFYEEDVDSK